MIQSVLLLSVLLSQTACQLAQVQTSADPQKRSASPDAVKKYQHALQLMELGNHDAALKVFEGVIKIDDQLSGPFANRGLIYLKSGDYDRAEAEFGEALRRNPSNVVAHVQLGVINRHKNRFEDARKHYQNALGIDPDDANAQLNMGVLCDVYLQDKSCAQRYYQAYQQAHPDDEEVNNWLLDLQGQL